MCRSTGREGGWAHRLAMQRLPGQGPDGSRGTRGRPSIPGRCGCSCAARPERREPAGSQIGSAPAARHAQIAAGGAPSRYGQSGSTVLGAHSVGARYQSFYSSLIRRPGLRRSLCGHQETCAQNGQVLRLLAPRLAYRARRRRDTAGGRSMRAKVDEGVNNDAWFQEDQSRELRVRVVLRQNGTRRIRSDDV
jgi:hypothetical protein